MNKQTNKQTNKYMVIYGNQWYKYVDWWYFYKYNFWPFLSFENI